MSRPILVLQMQRMGDLILSFPLFLWLERTFPGREIWVLAEKDFYEPLMRVSPKVTYFPWEGTGFLLGHSFKLVLNLSIREQAARLAAEVKAETRLGPVLHHDGSRYVHGPWQLYRASLVGNNRYNRYHWADLNALDIVPRSRMAKTTYSAPRVLTEAKPQVGLFLGASEAAKRPDPSFWAELCAELVERSIRPALFGGPQEQELGRAVRREFGLPLADFCGKFRLDQLTRAMQSLALFITPDTGPMHLAAWTGCRTINLSVGNVSPWETGPYTPGHVVLRADTDCAMGCWQCSRDRLYCHDPLTPAAVASTAARLALGREPANPPPGLDMATSGRERGLYHLLYTNGPPDIGHDAMAEFWKAFFGWHLGTFGEPVARSATSALHQAAPQAAEELAASLPGLIKTLRTSLKNRAPAGLWESSSQSLRPFTGWADLYLQNEDFSPTSFAQILDTVQTLMDLLQS